MAYNNQLVKTTLLLDGKSPEAVLKTLSAQANKLEKDMGAALRAGDTKKIKEIDREYKSIAKQLGQIKAATLDVDKVMKNLNGTSMKDLRKVAKDLNNEIDKLAPNTKEFIAKTEQLKLVKGRISEVTAQTRILNTTNQGMFTRMADGFNKYFGVFTAITASFAGIVFGARKAVDVFNKFDDQVADVMKTTGLTRDEVIDLDKSLQKIDTRTAQEDLLSLARVAGKLGIEGKEDVDGFVKAADKIKVALSEDLGGDVEESINQIGKLTDIFKLKNEFGIEDAMLKVGSAINSLGASSTANEGYIVEFTKRMAGVAPSANISISSIMGLGATLDQFGQQSEMASTAVGTVITEMFKDPGEFAKIAGVNVEEFSNLLKTDANEAFIQFLNGLNGNNEGLGYMANRLDELGIEGKRSIAVLGVLANNTDTLRKQQNLANEEFEKGTSLTEEFNIKNNTAQAQLEKKRKALSLITRELGEKFAPAMSFSTNILTKFLKLIGAAIDFYRENARWVNTAVAAIVTYTIAVNAATIAQKGYKIASDLALFATEKLTKSLKANPFGLMAAAVAGFVVAIQKYNTVNNRLNESIQQTQIELELEKKKMNDLFDELKKVNPESNRAKEIRNELNTVYKEYIPNLITEKTTNADLLKIQTQANNELTKSIILKSKRNAIEEQLSDIYEDIPELQNKIIKSIVDDIGLSTDQAAQIYNKFIQDTRENLTGAQDEIWKSTSFGIDLLNKEIKEYINAESAFNMMSNSLKSNTRELNDALKKEHFTVQEISAAYDALLPKVEDVTDATNNIEVVDNNLNSNATTEKDIEEQKKLLEQKLKDLETYNQQVRKLQNDLLQDGKKVLWEQYQDELANIDKLLISEEQKNELKLLLEEKFLKDIDAIDQLYLENQQKLDQEEIDAKKKTLEIIDDLIKKSQEEETEAAKKAFDEKMEMLQKQIDGYAKLGDSVTKIWSNANRMLDAKDKQRLNQIQENNDKSLEKVQDMYDQGVISKEDYDNRVAELNNKMENESKQLEMESAKRHAELALFEQSIATAVAIANGIVLAMKSESWYEAVIAAAAVVGEVVALMATASEYQVAVPQSAKGKYPVRGQDDGQLYNASYTGPVQTGYYPTPTLGLFSEKGPEIVVDAPTVRNIQMNQPEIIDAIYAMRVPQHAKGMYPANMSTGSNNSGDQLDLLKSMMTVFIAKQDELIQATNKSKKAYITLTDLEKAQDTKQTIESAVTRNRSI